MAATTARVVGRGSNGRVMTTASNDATDDPVAVKHGELFARDRLKPEACVEAATLTSLSRHGEKHPGVNGLVAPARFRGNGTQLALSSPLGRMDLWAFTRACPAPRRRELAKSVLTQLASALRFLHARGFVHGDLKPANVVVFGDDADPQVRIIDFGSATWTAGGAKFSGVCTYAYAAPELFAGETMNLATRDASEMQRADAYALGALVLTFVTGAFLGRADWDYARYKRFHECRDIRDEIRIDDLPTQARGLLEKDPARRKTVEDVYLRTAGAVDLTTTAEFPGYRGLPMALWPTADARATLIESLAVPANKDPALLALAVATVDRYAALEERAPSNTTVRACFAIAASVILHSKFSVPGSLMPEIRRVLERLEFDVYVRTVPCELGSGVDFGRLCTALIEGQGSSSRTLAAYRAMSA